MNKTGVNEKSLSLEECLSYADETKCLLIKKEADKDIPNLLEEYFKSGVVCLVADENTFTAAGKKLKSFLEESGIKISGSYIFPGEPRLHADYSYVSLLKEWLNSLPAFPRITPVSIGSGTINDLVKRTSSELNLPYLSFPTAASVDGYTPNGAALLVSGFKQTLACPAPLVIAADTDVLAGAPAYLNSSGFGDLAGKIIAGTDWIIAEKAGSFGAGGAPPIDPIAWSMVYNSLLPALKKSVKAAKGDTDALKALFESLAVTGFAMQYMKSSRPVSGSEHLLSHVWEMEGLSKNGIPVTHGFKVTIGTLAATAFTEIFFSDPKGPPPVPKTHRFPGFEERKAEIMESFASSRALEMILETAMGKMPDENTAKKTSEGFRDCWKETRDIVLEKLVPYGELKKILKEAGCPIKPEEIGLNRTDAIKSIQKAQMIRDRYGIFDLAWGMGNMQKAAETLEKSWRYLR
ncbi:MAG: sn-glycerol-1-phosphate dehydrogenase [Treponema sp.]|nr:sn-glycerol-1-phosphate dehydrogenase [Treponema sp.]